MAGFPLALFIPGQEYCSIIDFSQMHLIYAAQLTSISAMLEGMSYIRLCDDTLHFHGIISCFRSDIAESARPSSRDKPLPPYLASRISPSPYRKCRCHSPLAVISRASISHRPPPRASRARWLRFDDIHLLLFRRLLAHYRLGFAVCVLDMH